MRTTLGPKGMDNMLVNTIGDVVITVEVAKTQDEEVGDGTTTAVIILIFLVPGIPEIFIFLSIHISLKGSDSMKVRDRIEEPVEKAVTLKPEDWR